MPPFWLVTSSGARRLWSKHVWFGLKNLNSLSFFTSVRHEDRTWSLEHSDSVLSDSPGMMSSSVGTSKCSSPACVEARARRAAHCGYSDSHRPGLQYGDSFDSLGDSRHSDRWGDCSLSLSGVRGRSGHADQTWHTTDVMVKYTKADERIKNTLMKTKHYYLSLVSFSNRGCMTIYTQYYGVYGKNKQKQNQWSHHILA